MKPRIFISAVSKELGQARQLTANVLTRLGYEPVWQDVFGTEAGDLRAMLREQIDDCDGVVHLVGFAYGFEPPVPDAEFGRVSYTQYELLYARKRGKKAWLLFAEEGYPPDRPADLLDLPSSTDSDDPQSYRFERHSLQEAWRRRLRGDSQLYYRVTSAVELELQVERLKDELRILRRRDELWQKGQSAKLWAIAGLLLVGFAVVFYLMSRIKDDSGHRVPELVQRAPFELSKLRPEEIKAQFRSTIEEAYQQDLREADQQADWQGRAKARRAAASARDTKLAQVDVLLASITRTIGAGDASPEFLELVRIVQEQGVTQALSYVASQEESIISRAVEQHQGVRTTLAPLLESARLLTARGDYDAARRQCHRLLTIDPGWPEALRAQIDACLRQGDYALRYSTVDEAHRLFQTARESAERLLAVTPANADWPRVLLSATEPLGRTTTMLGDIGAAQDLFTEGVRVAAELVETDKGNVGFQRTLSSAHGRLGDVLLIAGRTEEALHHFLTASEIDKELATRAPDQDQMGSAAETHARLCAAYDDLGRYQEALTESEFALSIRRKLAEAAPVDVSRKRELAATCDRTSEALLRLGKTEEASSRAREAITLCVEMVKGDARNTRFQGDLARAHETLGRVSIAFGKADDALAEFDAALRIYLALAAADPVDAERQRLLAEAHSAIGVVQVRLGKHVSAIDQFQNGIRILDKLIEKRLFAGVLAERRRSLQKWIQHCRNGGRSYVATRELSVKAVINRVPASGVKEVNLWVNDGNGAWTLTTRIPVDIRQESKNHVVDVSFTAPRDGLYGFYLQPVSGTGRKPDSPRPGELALWQVEVDTTLPAVEVTNVGVEFDPSSGPLVTIRWTAEDKNLPSGPITLEYSPDSVDKGWQPIVTNLENSGRYLWNTKMTVGGKILIRATVIDKAGNIRSATFPKAIDLDSGK